MNIRQRARRGDEHADLPVPADFDAAGPGISTPEPLVSDEELEEIRWAGYDSAIADAVAHRDRALDAARERLDRATRAAYAEYGHALEAADATLAAARRAAMNAHELAQAGQPVPA